MNPVNFRWIERASKILLGARGYYQGFYILFQPDNTRLTLNSETFHDIDLDKCCLNDQPYVSRNELIAKLKEGKLFEWHRPELAKLIPLIADCAPVTSSMCLNVQPTVTYLTAAQDGNEQEWCLNDEGLFVANGTTSEEPELPSIPGARWAAYKSRRLRQNLLQTLCLIETLAKEKS